MRNETDKSPILCGIRRPIEKKWKASCVNEWKASCDKWKVSGKDWKASCEEK